MKNEDFELFQEFLEFKKFKESQGTEEPKKKKTKKTKYTKRSDGRYATSVIVGISSDGKKIKKTLYAKSIKELDVKVAECKIEVGKGTDFTKQSLLFRDYREMWWKGKQISINSIGTRKMYENVFNYITPLDYLSLKDISSDDIQAIINEKKEHQRTCVKIKVVLKQIFDKAIADRIIYYNPVNAVFFPKYVAKERRPLTNDENILTELDIFTDRERAFIMLLKYTGIRRAEALALTKSDFNIPEATLCVSKALEFDGNKAYLKSTKNGSTRYIPLPTNILGFISYYLTNLKTELLFTNLTSDGYMTHRGYYRMWEAITNKLEAEAAKQNRVVGKDLSAHIFRHNYACMLMYASVDMKERQYLLGHKTIAMTMNVYTHIETSKVNAPQLLNKYLAQS